MPIDFSSMLDDDAEVVLHPRDIFFTLDRQSNFSFPRDIQTEVMNQWFEQRKYKDNIIKLNVGSGKTLVGLLLLQSSLNEKQGPALFITPDKYLSNQVINEANALGIDVTDNPRDPDYIAGEKICVTNIYKLFNGKSVFGVGVSEIEIGSLIIDDAHACVSTISDQFRIRLSNDDKAYQEILSKLSNDLNSYNKARFLDVQSADPQAYMEVPFWAWQYHHDEVLTILHSHRLDDNLKFTYPLISEMLMHCRCVIGGKKLEIEPYFPATDLFQSFRRAKRRIYMTATLADDSVIATHFGADPSEIKKPIVPSSSQSMGERMILMPQELNTNFTIKNIAQMLFDLSKKENVVVIVPSEGACYFWREYSDKILMGDTVSEGVEELRTKHVGLTILVNRYDGIDLPKDACRVLAIIDLPEVSSFSEMVNSEVLSNTTLNLQRQVERIEQGMGRGVRSNEDYCAVLLVGEKLTGRIRSSKGQEMLTPATKAQLDLSRKIAKSMNNPSIDDVKDVILQCLNRDTGWIRFSRQALIGLQADDSLKLDRSKLAIKKSFDFVRANEYQAAISSMDSAINDAPEDCVKAWLLSIKATFQNHLDANAAQKTLKKAHKLERSVLKPISGSEYRSLAPHSSEQAKTLIDNHKERFIEAVDMKLYVNALCNDLIFQKNTSDKFEAAIDSLAWFLGIKSQRPEKDYREGPDNLWALPYGEFFIIECKNGITSENGISKKDAGQLGQSVEWFAERYPNSKHTPIIIHPQTKLGKGASSVNNMRILDKEKLEKLCSNLRKFSDQIANPDVYSSASEVARRLTQFELKYSSIVSSYTKSVIKVSG